MAQGYAVGNINAGVQQLACGGRLTLTSGLPVTTSDVTAATSVYFTPYLSGYISLYNSTLSVWQTLPFAEITISVPASTSQMYDVFAYISSGAVACETLAWTNDTTRATGLVLQNGIYVKSGATDRRYIGSFRTTTVSGQTEDSLAKRYVWNYNNRVERPMKVIDTTDSWNYSTGSYRQANNSAANQLDMVIGVSEDQVSIQVVGMVISTGNNTVSVGVGIDSTTAFSGTVGRCGTSTTIYQNPVGFYQGFPGIGRHYAAWLECGGGSNTQTWYGDFGGALVQTGIQGYLRG